MSLPMMPRRMKRGDITAHGFRSTFSDWASEVSSYDGELHETALAHTIKNKAERAYRGGDALEKRRRMMEGWANWCVPMPRADGPPEDALTSDGSSRQKSLTKDSGTVLPLNNLISRMPEFEHFTAVGSKRWTLPMAAAWFIWRDLAAVDDQWKILTGAWAPLFDPPIFILGHHRQQPGTLTCVFQQVGFACGQRPYRRLQDIDDFPSSKTTDPYERLRVALQTGRLRATVVEQSLEEAALTERDLGMDGWFDLDALADPANDAPYHFLSDPARYAVLVSREEAVRAEAELSAAEAERHAWKLEQALGWIAYRRDRSFRALGRIDLRAPTLFGRSYKNDFDEPRPLATLASALLSGEVRAYVQGIALTRAECISLLSDEDGLWSNQDLAFVPDEMRGVWQRRAESRSKISDCSDRRKRDSRIGDCRRCGRQYATR